MAGGSYIILVKPSENAGRGRIALDPGSMSKAGLAEGMPVEVTVNGKKLALLVEKSREGVAALNAGEAGGIGLRGEVLVKMRKIKVRELRSVTLRVEGSGSIDPSRLRAFLVLRPLARGASVFLGKEGNFVELRVVDCEPEDGIVSMNTRIVIT